MGLRINLPEFTADDEVDLIIPDSITFIDSVTVEPVGHWFHRADAIHHAVATGIYLGTRKIEATKKDDAQDRTFTRDNAGGKFVKLTDDDLETDWYDLLKLPQCEGATEAEIRAAYRRRCLETHPDKQPDRSDRLFKRVQRAFEILGCPNTRRAYDSSRPFDDLIPDDVPTMDENTFFSVFRPVFDRNRKWSVDTKIPRLGDLDTSIKEVNRFYDAWYRFNSWRDFSNEADVEEINENMSRDEKRYYQRENQRILDKHKRAEQKRIRTLVERAQKLDPRIRKVREAETAAKEKEKADRLAEKERIRNEEALRKQAIAEKERAEKQAAADAIQAQKDRIKACEKEMFDFFNKHGLIENVDTNMIQTFFVRPPNIAFIFAKVGTVEEAEELLAAVTKEDTKALPDKSVPAVIAFNNLVTTREELFGMTRYGERIKKVTPEEIAARKKAEEEKKAAERAKAASGTLWTADDLEVLQKAIARYPGGTVDRWRKMAQMLHDKFTEDEVLTKTKELENLLRKGVQGPQVLASTVAPSASAAAAGAAEPDVDSWSLEQQKQLENGLRELVAYKEKDKFQKVAKFVTGKTAKQCFDRYKYLCTLSKAKK